MQRLEERQALISPGSSSAEAVGRMTAFRAWRLDKMRSLVDLSSEPPSSFTFRAR